MSKKLFYEDPYRKDLTTQLNGTFEDEGRFCVHLEENIFYPHGGGQKGDRGELHIDDKIYTFLNTIKDKYSDDDVLIITKEFVPEIFKGKNVICKLDWDFRYRQMKLHSCVHLHHCMIENVLGKKISHPIVSNIEDGFAFNRYDCEEITKEVVDKANEIFLINIQKGAEVTTYPDIEKKGYRWWECLNYKIPCGGTHIKNLNEIGNVEIKYSTKNNLKTINIKLN